jgi:LysM repeat protein
MDPKTEVKVKENSSPDLTHQITVKAGDTLPMLCQKVYGDRQMFHEVARVNNLLSFRHIEPGTELIFPPIK